MADTSLDDFFAKKDKSKKKKKSKFTADDILAKQKEEPKKPEEDKSISQRQTVAKDGDALTVTEQRKVQDEQWDDFVEEKDYSGLKIQNIQIAEEEAARVAEEVAREAEENEEGGEDGEGPAGPWKPVAGGPVVQRATPPPEHETVIPVLPNTQGGKYIPPSMRGQPAAGSGPASGPKPRRGKPKHAPKLDSEEDFPTLGGPAPHDAFIDDGTYSKVRSGGRQQGSDLASESVELGNKFSSLGAE